MLMHSVSSISSSDLVPYLRVDGGEHISGEVRINGAKNSALVLMAASLLTKENVHIFNVPKLTDINVMAKLLSTIGSNIKQKGHEP